MRKSICVVFGGQSPEHDISQKSVVSVIKNLDKEKYEIHTVGITKDGKWYLYTGGCDKIESGEWELDKENLKKAIISPDTTDHGLIIFDDNKTSILKIDVVFPVLHGEYGEDGTIQGLLELSGIKYVGMGVLSSANGMDKSFSKIVFDSVNIPQADWIIVKKGDNFEEMIKIAEEKIGYPCFVKPASTGSSVGVGKAKNHDELLAALENAMNFGRKVLIEENIDGHEVECAVLGNENPIAGEVGEIIPTVEFYDFDAKYKDNSTKLQIPANIPLEVREKIREYAVKAFCALDGSGLSRVDFFVKYSDNSVILNEINTLPGFTNISMYPKLMGAVGFNYPKLLDKLIEFAEKRVK